MPGFRFTLGVTLTYLTLMVIIPLSNLVWAAKGISFGHIWQLFSSPRVLAACRLSFLLALCAAAVNGIFGTLLAWVLVRYRFWGRKFVDAMVDLPVALPTAVAGIALAAIYSKNGLIGGVAQDFGVEIAFTPYGILVALIFVGLPFQVRTVQPILQDLEKSFEEAATTLGATPIQSFFFVSLPQILPGIITGCCLAFARAIGEYGSVVFIAGNIPLVSEIAPLLIVSKLEQYDYGGATAIALLLLLISLVMLLGINSLQNLLQRFRQE